MTGVTMVSILYLSSRTARMRAWRFLVLFLVAAFPVVTATAQQTEIFGETMEVRVGTIDIVVTDRAGNPIHGLKAEDFQLFIDGKPQEIAAFDEIRGAVRSVDKNSPSSVAGRVKAERAPRHII